MPLDQAGRVMPKFCVVAALVVITIALSGCDKNEFGFKVNARATCANYDGDASMCTSWTHTGTIEADWVGCFPGESLVTTLTGTKRMDEVTIGEEILGFDHVTGKAKYSKVRAWLTRDPKRETSMLSIHTTHGKVVTTLKHNLATPDGYVFANSLKAGDTLVSSNGNTTVKQVLQEEAKGSFSPLTETSNFFVGDTHEGSRVLAHSFDRQLKQNWYYKVFHAALSLGELVYPDLNELPDVEAAYFHPFVREMVRWAGYDVDKDGKMTIDDRRLRSTGHDGGGGEEDQMKPVVLFVTQSKPPFL